MGSPLSGNSIYTPREHTGGGPGAPRYPFWKSLTPPNKPGSEPRAHASLPKVLRVRLLSIILMTLTIFVDAGRFSRAFLCCGSAEGRVRDAHRRYAHCRAGNRFYHR